MLNEKLRAFFLQQEDETHQTNLEKAQAKAQVIRRIATTDQSKSYETAEPRQWDTEHLPGVVITDGKVIGFGIHIFNEDVYPLKSFEIYLRGCGLTGRLDLSDCADLIFVDLYNNHISSVELGSLPALRILGLQNNAISALDPSGLPACQGIDIGKNCLSALDVSQNAELVELYINDNNISEIDLSHNPKLKYFYCHNNKIKTLDTTHNPLLRHLNATGNPMTAIYALAPQQEETLPLTLKAETGGHIGLKFNPIYNAQWKETGEWEQCYEARAMDGFTFAGWYDEAGNLVNTEATWKDVYGASRILTARFIRN